MFATIVRIKNFVTWLLEQVLIGSVAVMVLVVLWGIATRFLFGSPSRWTEEVSTNLLIWVALLGAAVAFGRQEHLGLDYFVNKLDPAAQRLNAIIIQLATSLFAAAAMVYGGYVLVAETLHAGQLTPVLGVKMGYVYLAVPLSGVFILLYGIERLMELFRGADPKGHEVLSNEGTEAKVP
jgi:TRAP-type C4-dicarboxylate transport system permease small subunit